MLLSSVRCKCVCVSINPTRPEACVVTIRQGLSAHTGVLGLAGMGVAFFIAAGAVVCISG